MQTRSSSRLVSNPSSNPTPSTNPNLKVRNHRRSKQRIENFNLEELSPPIVTMSDQRTMAQLLQAPIEGYEDVIIVPAITADNFELKHGLLTLVQNKHEAWDRFKDLLRACPHQGFSELHQLDTFYNALNSKDQDSLNSAAGGNFLDKMPRECLAIIESKSKVCYFHVTSPLLQKLLPTKLRLLKHKVFQRRIFLAYIKSNDAVMRNMQTRGQNMQNQLINLTDLITKFVNSNSVSTLSSGTLPSNTIANPRSDLKAITTQSGVSYDGPQIPPSPSFLLKVVENKPEVTKDTVNPTNNESTKDVQPRVVQSESLILYFEHVTSPISEPVIASISASKPNPKTSIPYPSRRND
nr:reverse transcriptase domain-containing protein [Tanacetum cinerariifolium]